MQTNGGYCKHNTRIATQDTEQGLDNTCVVSCICVNLHRNQDNNTTTAGQHKAALGVPALSEAGRSPQTATSTRSVFQILLTPQTPAFYPLDPLIALFKQISRRLTLI